MLGLKIMGNQTCRIIGNLKFDRPLKEEHAKYLCKFIETCHYKRNVDLVDSYADPLRLAAELPLGTFAEYFVGDVKLNDQAMDESIISPSPPSDQPSNTCGWILTADYSGLASESNVNRNEEYIQWLNYLIKNFFIRWEYMLNGRIIIQSDNPQLLIVNNNMILTSDMYQFILTELTEKDARILELEARIEMLENEVQFNPDGKGAREAKKHFYSLVGH